MWDNAIEYLKDPLLVVKVQNFFGVIYKSTQQSNDSSEVIHSDRQEFMNEEFDLKQHKRIPSNISSSSQSSQSSCDTDSSQESGGKEVVCTINNRFWYYVFVLGTALGDEIFYATFIPFWFWNIDGAVGRRVVLVWTVVMYIGKYFLLTKFGFIYTWEFISMIFLVSLLLAYLTKINILNSSNFYMFCSSKVMVNY